MRGSISFPWLASITGHVWKPGIPAQIAKRSSVHTEVILPEIPHIIEPELVTPADADYVMLD
jgi:hypothetical protein